MKNQATADQAESYNQAPTERKSKAPHAAFGWLPALTAAQGRLLLMLWCYADPSRTAPVVWPNNATLARWSGSSRGAVRRTLAGLVAAGAVTIIQDPDTGRRRIRLMPSGADPRRKKRKPKPAPEPAPDQLDLGGIEPIPAGDQADPGGDHSDPGGGSQRSPEEPSEQPTKNQERESARARGSASPHAAALPPKPRADWRAVLASIHDRAPRGAYRSVDPQHRDRPPVGLLDLLDELGPDRMVALWDAYARICERDAEQLPWWGPNMFREPQAGVVLRLATPELRRIEQRRREAAEAERRQAELDASVPDELIGLDPDALADAFFAKFENIGAPS